MTNTDPEFWIRSKRRDSFVWVARYYRDAAAVFAAGHVVRLATSEELTAAGEDHNAALSPAGRSLCYWCRAEVPKGRRSWCSNECVADYKLHHDWATIRGAVRKRDGGVCVACGVNADKLRRIMGSASYFACGSRYYGAAGRDLIRETLAEIGLARMPRDLHRDWWEADHIHARSEGGPDHPRNLRTLCVHCHKERTRAQQAAWATARRTEKMSLKSPMFGCGLALGWSGPVNSNGGEATNG